MCLAEVTGSNLQGGMNQDREEKKRGKEKKRGEERKKMSLSNKSG